MSTDRYCYRTALINPNWTEMNTKMKLATFYLILVSVPSVKAKRVGPSRDYEAKRKANMPSADFVSMFEEEAQAVARELLHGSYSMGFSPAPMLAPTASPSSAPNRLSTSGPSSVPSLVPSGATSEPIPETLSFIKCDNDIPCALPGCSLGTQLVVAQDPLECCPIYTCEAPAAICPNLSDMQASTDPNCVCTSAKNVQRELTPQETDQSVSVYACVFPDYSDIDCASSLDCMGESQCAGVKADYNGPNQPLDILQTQCIPVTGSVSGKPCYTSQFCASNSCVLGINEAGNLDSHLATCGGTVNALEALEELAETKNNASKSVANASLDLGKIAMLSAMCVAGLAMVSFLAIRRRKANGALTDSVISDQSIDTLIHEI